MNTYLPYIANTITKPSDKTQTLTVLDKYSGQVFAKVQLAGEQLIHQAVESAHAAQAQMQAMPIYQRAEILTACQQGLIDRRAEFEKILIQETGKTIGEANAEIDRAISTFGFCAAACSRPTGEVLPLDMTQKTQNTIGLYKRFPIAPCLFITPFNFPVNLAAHKIGPAIAAGCSFILKPSDFTPVSALLLGEILAKTSLPKGAFSIAPCTIPVAQKLVESDQIRLLSFTGSAKVGWELKKLSGQKEVILELGGNASCVIDSDWEINDDLITKIATAGFSQAGQSCISVQRVFVHESHYALFKEKLIEKTQKLCVGDPSDPKTQVGPMINNAAIERIDNWVQAARGQGANILIGGKADGRFFMPTLLENVPEDNVLCTQEAFAPIIILSAYTQYEDVLETINNSQYGLQAGVFTKDINKAMLAWEQLAVGGVVIGNVPTWRADNMPYGGTKGSGLGREGVMFAIEQYTEPKMLIFNQ